MVEEGRERKEERYFIPFVPILFSNRFKYEIV